MNSRYRTFAELAASITTPPHTRPSPPVRPLSAQVTERLWAKDTAESR